VKGVYIQISYNLYCVGGVVKPCPINQSISQPFWPSIGCDIQTTDRQIYCSSI